MKLAEELNILTSAVVKNELRPMISNSQRMKVNCNLKTIIDYQS